MSIEQPRADYKPLMRFGGVAASRGIAIGPAYRFYRTLLFAEDRTLAEEEVVRELERFEAAVKKAKLELEKVRRVAEQKVGAPASSIFEAQMMMVSDEFILKTVRQRVKDELKPAAFVVDAEFSKYQHMLQTGDNPIMRERVDDVEDIKQRILRYLLDREKWLSRIDTPSILVAEMLTPADAILFARANVLGFAMDSGGVTSHVAILAKSLGIPAVVAMHTASQNIKTGDLVILDGERGELILNPDKDTIEGYERERNYFTAGASEPLQVSVDEEIPHAKTADSHPVTIYMNLEFGSEVAIAEAERLSVAVGTKENKDLGLGLVRTEHFLLLHEDFPTEQEQTVLYKDMAERFYPAPVTLRTFDVGGDKVLSGSYREENPFLGWRGLRISLDEPELFLGQLRAVLRASARGNVKLLFPMVTNVEELRLAMQFLDQAKHDLHMQEEAFDEHMKVGAMIEVPSAAMMAAAIVPLVDFLSIGSNDLTQYTLAVDRGNDLISNLYQELHPAVLRLIDMTIKAAHKANKPVCICGELGSYPLATPVLVGLGVDEISVSPSQVRSLAARIRLLKHEETKQLAHHILNDTTSPEEVKQRILSFLTERHLIAPFAEANLRPNFGGKLAKR